MASPQRTRRTPVRAFICLVLVALLLSGCRSVVETLINTDGSGELRSSVVFSAEERANFEASAENARKSICDNLKPETEADIQFVEEVRGDETFCTTVRSFASLAELRGFYGRMGNVEVNALEMLFGTFTFDVQVDSTARNGNEPGSGEWRLTVPGEIDENNADAVEGQTFIWNVQLGLVRTLHVESVTGVDRMTLLFIGGGIGDKLALLIFSHDFEQVQQTGGCLVNFAGERPNFIR